MARELVVAVDLGLAAYFLGLAVIHTLLLGISARSLLLLQATRLLDARWELLSGDTAPSVTIIAPAFDEEKSIVSSIEAMRQIEYPALEVMVVNDGSGDDTLLRLQRAFELRPVLSVPVGDIEHEPVLRVYKSALDPRVTVVDKVNGGKADALNAGIDIASTDLVCCVDADTVIDREAIRRMVEPFVFSSAPVVAVGGSIRIANGCVFDQGQVQSRRVPWNFLARMQVLEYLRAFCFFRLGLARANGNIIISGALGMFRRRLLVDIGGYDTQSVGEDIELVLRLHRHMHSHRRPYRVEFRPDAYGYTEAPTDWQQLGQQRDRWQRGLVDGLWTNRFASFGGLVGYFTIPFHWLFEVFGPLVHLFGIFWMGLAGWTGRLNYSTLGVVVAIGIAASLAVSLHALILDQLDGRAVPGRLARLRLVLAALGEPVLYQPVISFYRLRGLYRFLVGDRRWGRQNRRGFEEKVS